MPQDRKVRMAGFQLLVRTLRGNPFDPSGMAEQGGSAAASQAQRQREWTCSPVGLQKAGRRHNVTQPWTQANDRCGTGGTSGVARATENQSGIRLGIFGSRRLLGVWGAGHQLQEVRDY